MIVIIKNNRISWFLFLIIFIFNNFIPTYAQISASQNNKITPLIQRPPKCKTDELVNHLFKTDPTYKKNWELLNRQILQIQSEQGERLIPGSLYIIPTVVHIIHNNGVENITDAQVLSQITRVNEDFRKILGTLGYGAGVDTKIEFCLATIDPVGNPTTGITRNQSSLTNVTTGGGGTKYQ